MNKFVFTAPVVLPPIKYVRVISVDNVTDNPKHMSIALEITGDSGMKLSASVEVFDGEARGITVNRDAVNPSALFAPTTAVTAADNPAIATAWSSIFAAYATAGNDGILTELSRLGLIPAGIAT